MATKKDPEPVRVALEHPDGTAYEAATPEELHTLVSGYGYKITEKNLDLNAAAERLAVNVGEPDTAGALPGPASNTTATGTTPAVNP